MMWRPKKPNLTMNEHKLNDHIYELYRPRGDLEPTMEILFFHGLQFESSEDAYLSTWTSPGDDSTGPQVWPGTWLAEVFPSARILSMSYDSSMKRTPEQGRADLLNVAENLIQAILLAEIGQGFRLPVILVGHSFGGLVIKKLCTQAHHRHSLRPAWMGQKIENFLHNVGGIYFYGTPHSGSALGDMASLVLSSPLLAYVKLLSTESARLHEQFCNLRIKYKMWSIAAVGELLPTRWRGFDGVVVPEASARYGDSFCTVQADHFSLCKPTAKTSNSFQLLTNFVRSIVPKDEVHFENKQRIPKVVAGLDLVVDDVQDKLEGNARVGIFGMGGVGKTTIAMAVFNKLCPRFEYSCFVLEVKKLIPKEVEGNLKKEMWKRLHCRGKKFVDPETDDWRCRNREDWSQLRGKKLLLVLDDVAEDRHLRVLLDIAEDMAPESRVIVTSRNVGLFTSIGEDIYGYAVQFLNRTNAKELFMSYAFQNQAALPIELEPIVDLVVEKCGGLPLTLEVLGKYLKGRKELDIWEQTLRALDKADNVAGLDQSLWAKLRLSYTGLSTPEEKQMFLDATTFFSDSGHWTLRDAKAAWSVVYGEYVSLWWRTLVEMSLVHAGKDDEPIRVHEQLQSMGREIASDASKNGKCMRVWKTAEGLKLLESTDKSTDQEILSLRLVLPKLAYDINIPRSFRLSLKKLKFLDISVIDKFEFKHTKHFSFRYNRPWKLETLALLRCPTLQFGQILYKPALLPCLAVLELFALVGHLPRSIGQLSSLKIFRIRGAMSLYTLPDEIGLLSVLQRLEFHSCFRLDTLPGSFGDLRALSYLEFSDCPLRVLPKSFGQLASLKHLEFRRCSLRTLPESFGLLSVLEHLEIHECNMLRTLPNSFGQLSALKHLEFRIRDVETLPDSFGQLSVLEHLEFHECNRLHTLPNSFGQLRRLEHLEFFSCAGLQILPGTFGHLSALKHLEFCICKNLQTLPESFGQLSSLTHLEFFYCDNLHTRPDSFGQLASLEKLIIFYCRKIESLLFHPEQVKALHFLAIESVALPTIPDCIKSLPSLQILEVGFLPYLEEWPPWLGGMRTPPWLGETLSDLSKLSWKFSRTQNGYFALMEHGDMMEPKHYSRRRKVWFRRELQLHEWLHANAVDKVTAVDYDSAIASLEVALKFLSSTEMYKRRFFLQEMGIIKRYKGDLPGALEDLTLALENPNEGHDALWSEWQRLGYNCRKHRGYVKYLMGDEEGAREDGQEALELVAAENPMDFMITYEPNGGLPEDFVRQSLGDASVSYLDFRLIGFEDMETELLVAEFERMTNNTNSSTNEGRRVSCHPFRWLKEHLHG